MSARIQARRIDIRGVVQGVGFRPFVYRIAYQHAIKGWVRNDSRGVTIHAEASRDSLDAFVRALRDQSPAAASIASLTTANADLERFVDFKIFASEAGRTPTAKISPDLPTCEACLAELFDSESPRYLYPYINCTACGPRYSIIRSLPYDRPNTTMEPWELCEACRAEYDDPANRRHHAQPTACN
jgi:hydrogenase maturation protein HypF